MACVRTDCYRVISDQLPWSQANASCVKDGGHLAFAVNIAAIGTLLRQLGIQRAWIGATQTVGNWTWQDGSETSYTDWFGHSSDDHCAALGRSNPHTDAHGWKPDKCHKKKGYLCQIPNRSIQTCTGQMVETDFVDTCYFLNNTNNFSWFSARDECRKAGGNLARFSSEAQWKPIAERYKDYSKARGKSVKAWIGLTRISWHWTSGERLTANLWNDDAPGRAGNCLVANNDTSISRYRWKDWDCAKPLPYVCQTAYAPRKNTAGYKIDLYIGVGVAVGLVFIVAIACAIIILTIRGTNQAKRNSDVSCSRCDLNLCEDSRRANMDDCVPATLPRNTHDVSQTAILPKKQPPSCNGCNVNSNGHVQHQGNRHSDVSDQALNYSETYCHRPNGPDRRVNYSKPYGHRVNIGSLKAKYPGQSYIDHIDDVYSYASARTNFQLKSDDHTDPTNEFARSSDLIEMKENDMYGAESEIKHNYDTNIPGGHLYLEVCEDDDYTYDTNLVSNIIYEHGNS